MLWQNFFLFAILTGKIAHYRFVRFQSDEGGFLLHITICDDNLQDASLLHNYIQQYMDTYEFFRATISVVTDSAGLLAAPRPDLLFLDIELNRESGIALAKTVNETYPETLIVFVSAHSCYVTDSYCVRAAHFLTKPLKPLLFQTVMQQVMKLYHSQYAFVERRINGKIVRVPLQEVVCIEARGKSVILTLSNGRILEYAGSFATESADFHSPDFERAHRSYIISLRHLKRIYYNRITLSLKNGQELIVPVGRTQYHQITEAYLHYKML